MADDQNISAQIRGKIKNYAAAGKVQQGRLLVNGASMPQRIESDGSFARPYIFTEGSNSVYAAAGKVQQGRLVVNGASMPQRIESDGSFARPYIFTEGSNSVQVISPDGQSRQKMQFYSTPGAGAIRARLRLVLSWDTDNTDLDLHVVTPDGEHAWYGNTVLKNSGALDMDVTTGYGPEIFAMPAPVHGRYQVYINYYGGRARVYGWFSPGIRTIPTSIFMSLRLTVNMPGTVTQC